MPALSEEEEQSLIRDLGSKTLSGIATVAAPLDFLGGGVRNLLAGRAPSLDPFGHEGRTTGRELLEGFGILGRNRPGLDFGDVAGFAAEVALDPLTYLTFGASALSKAGQVAKRAGILGNVGLVSKGAGKRVGRIRTSLDDLISKSGPKAAERAETAARALGTSVRELGSQKVGGLVGVGIPFARPFGVAGTGATAEKVASSLDFAGEFLAKTPPARAARTLFDASVEGHFGVHAQKLASAIHGRKKGVEIAARELKADAMDSMDEVFKGFDQYAGEMARVGAPRAAHNIPGVTYQVGDVVQSAADKTQGIVQKVNPENSVVWFRNKDTLQSELRNLPHDAFTLVARKGTTGTETLSHVKTFEVFDRITRMVAETEGNVPLAFEWVLPGIDAPTGKLADDIVEVGRAMKAANLEGYQDFLNKGGAGSMLEGTDEFAQFPRSVNRKVAEETAKRRLAQTSFSGAKHRRVATARIPTEIVEKMRKAIKTGKKDGLAARVGSKFARFIDEAWGLREETEAFVAEFAKTGRGDLRTAVDSFTDDYVRSGKGVAAHTDALIEQLGQGPAKRQFTKLTTTDFFEYQKSLGIATKTIDSIHELFIGNFLKEGAEGVGLKQAFTAANMNADQAMKHLSELTGESVEQLAARQLPADVAKAAQSIIRPHIDRPWAKAIGETIDTVTQWFKNNVTILHPAFWTRNGVSGQTINIVSGDMETLGDVASYTKEVFRNGKNAKNLTASELREVQFSGIIGRKLSSEDVDAFRGAAQGVEPGKVFDVRQNYIDAAQHVADNPNPLNPRLAAEAGRIATGAAKAGGSVRRVYRQAMQTGGKINQHVEWANRVPMFLWLRKRGFTLQEAAARVKELQFDYSELAPFEKSVMKRLMPFYTFSRKIAGLTLSTLTQRPGGALANLIRLSAKGHDPGTLTPDYIAGTAAVPLEPGPTGADRFLTGFGFAHEDPASFLGAGVRGGALEALSRTNPIFFKGPLEFATNESFFQRGPSGGRALTDLDPVLGRTAANVLGRDKALQFPQGLEVAFSNSPLSRFGTAIRTATDTRKTAADKAANLLTGFKVTTVPERTKDAILREGLAERMRSLGARSFTRNYFPKQMIQRMPPDQKQAALEFQALNNMLAKRARDRAAAAREADQF